ncbi:hypothetical protein [Xylophilus sp. GOD-11R]|uniref:hypothetical protein n=1 Tax=Xylophilus sp. GOD-11R TaxID=3089814 RepID=UPI00298D59A2|nr:hypothetical protein [Xylophilus sp. GOD-11R]WPB57486.1 hypothetical protein R9X41_02180 [Xylophilus sp. GOD-11R]
MNALQTEFRRLYAPHGPADAPDRVRAIVLEVLSPPGWSVLSRVWQEVQATLGLPAPAIAVSGTDGMQLWFSVAASVPAETARAFLQGLCRRFVPDLEDRHLRLWPHGAEHAPPVPAPRGMDGNWSAFVAPDLAPVFADTPWLDVPPGDEGQASLLRGLQPMKPGDFDRACRALSPAAPAVAMPPASAAPPAAPGTGEVDARSFLRRVLNDESAPLALRVEAARTLLQHPG